MIKARHAWAHESMRASGRVGQRGARGDWTSAPPSSIGDRLFDPGDGAIITLGDICHIYI
jgi:hypothetical protein